jgi:segregation and condensation protein A
MVPDLDTTEVGVDQRVDAKQLGTQDSRPETRGVAAYRVQIDLFEGPLDLLLHLIKKNEVDVTNIPVAAITEQYLAYIDVLRELNLDVAGEYLVMAATLTLVKSRMLLPSPPGEDEEEADPRADLIRQLLEYQRYREAAQHLGEAPLLGRDVFTREQSADGVELTEDGRVAVRATMWELLEALQRVLKRAQPEPVHEVDAEPVSLRDCVQRVLGILGVARSIAFESLFDERSTRVQVIVTFLAVLELMKIGAVEAIQEEHCGTIAIVLAVEDASQVSIDLSDDYEGAVLPLAEEQSDG